GQSVTFTATVLSGNNPVTEGTVTFKEGNSILAGNISLDQNGKASFSTSFTSGSTHTITAVYSGTANFATSSGSVDQMVVCGTITVSPSSLPSGTQFVPYSQSVSASGGIAPYTFSVSSGLLPTGLSLNSTTGAITGTPALPGTFPFTITATDTNGCTGSQA